MYYEMMFICVFYGLILMAYSIAYTKEKVVKFYNCELDRHFDEARDLIEYR